MFTDPVLLTLVQKYPQPSWQDRTDFLFEDLVEVIISQQLSVKAADTIIRRFRALFIAAPDAKLEIIQVEKTNGVPKNASLDGQPRLIPQHILALQDEQLRAVGISGAKARYIKGVAEAFASGQMSIEKIKHLSDEAVMEELIKLKGIGKWSAEMLLIFTLNRPDVFSLGDAGLRRAIKTLYQCETDAEILRLAETWKPNRSLACWYLWRSLENS
jgi:DNA-3-methyladenine glycosylase II